MRKINRIIIHCSATPEGRDVSVDDIRRMHVKENGWADIGYHYVITIDGVIHAGRPIELPGAHCRGCNATSIGICYIGGVARDGISPRDTRTPAQREALVSLVRQLRSMFPDASVHGHNEFAAKDCPSFNVQTSELCLI